MTSEWREARLGDVCKKIGSGATPRGGNESYFAEGPFSLIRRQNVLNDRFSYNGLAYISDEQAKKLEGVAVEPDDVLLNITGDSVARSCMVANEVLPARVNQHVTIIRPEPEHLNPFFLRYFLVSPEQQNRMLGLASSGGTRNALTKGMIENFRIPLPPLPEQRAIARILGSLDDKIELNRRTNATLESLAQTLFRAWFVDFEPVKAKASGVLPVGMDAQTAAHFPDSFEPSTPAGSTPGLIPKGWKVGKLGDIFTEQTARMKEQSAVVLSAVSSSELVRSDEYFRKQVYSKSVKNYKAVAQWDFAYNPSRINIGSIGMLEHNFVGAVSPIYAVMRPAEGFHWWANFSLRQSQVRKYVVQYCSGSVRQALSARNFQSIPCIVPPQEVASAFAEWYSLIRKTQIHYDEQSQTLTQLRDALLPRLISGRLRVPSNFV